MTKRKFYCLQTDCPNPELRGYLPTLFAAVALIAKKRHPRMRHLHPDLMESSRFQLHFQKCPVSLTCQTFPG